MRAYGWLRLPAPGRSEVEEPPPVRVPGFGVEFVLPEPSGVPPTEGVTGGLGVGRSDSATGVPVPGPGAAGVPGFMVVPAPGLLREGDVGRGAVALSRSACAAAV